MGRSEEDMTTDPRFWDQLAEKYAAQPVSDPAAFARKIEVMKARLRPTDVVVELGCGTGSLALILAPFAGAVHGLDYSPEMIRIARGKVAPGDSHVHFHVGAAEDPAALPVAEGGADLVLACSLLHLVPDRQAVLARLLRLLKPGGTLVASTVCLGESWVPYRPILTVMQWLGKAPPVWALTKAGLADELRRAGFVEVDAPDVGAEPKVSFLTGRKPPAGAPA